MTMQREADARWAAEAEARQARSICPDLPAEHPFNEPEEDDPWFIALRAEKAGRRRGAPQARAVGDEVSESATERTAPRADGASRRPATPPRRTRQRRSPAADAGHLRQRDCRCEHSEDYDVVQERTVSGEGWQRCECTRCGPRSGDGSQRCGIRIDPAPYHIRGDPLICNDC